MREITSHVVNPSNDNLTIKVTDEPGAGGANHRYEVGGMIEHRNPSWKEGRDIPGELVLLFQNGPIGEHGLNGITQEVLLSIVADRLLCFQAGPFASIYNAEALEHVQHAMEALLRRTRERMARGVEGKTVA